MQIFLTQYWPGLLGASAFLLSVGLFSSVTGQGIKGTPSREEDPNLHRIYVVLSIVIGSVALILGMVGRFL